MLGIRFENGQKAGNGDLSLLIAKLKRLRRHLFKCVKFFLPLGQTFPPPRDSFHCPKITGSQLLHLTNGLLQPNHGRKLCGPLIHSLIKRVSRNFTVSNRPDLSRYRRFLGHNSDFIPDEAIRDTKFKSPHKNCFPLISKLLSESLKVGDIFPLWFCNERCLREACSARFLDSDKRNSLLQIGFGNNFSPLLLCHLEIDLELHRFLFTLSLSLQSRNLVINSYF